MSESVRPEHDLKDLVERVLLEFEEVIAGIIERPVIRRERQERGAPAAALVLVGAASSEPA